MDVLEYKGKFNFQNRDWNKTSVDKLKELRQVALMAFKSQDNSTEMPGKESGEDAFKKWTAKLHCALKPILWEVCSDTYTVFKIEHPDHDKGVRDDRSPFTGGGSRTHVAVPKNLLTTEALYHSATEVLMEFDKYFGSPVV